MKNMMMAAVLIGCMIMCGCNVGKDSSSTKGTTNTATTTTAARTFSEKTDDTPASGISDSEKNTNENEENSSKRELQEFTTNADDIDFMIDDDSAAITGETKQAITNMTTSLDNNTGVNNGNVMHDDGLDWSPLTPVD